MPDRGATAGQGGAELAGATVGRDQHDAAAHHLAQGVAHATTGEQALGGHGTDDDDGGSLHARARQRRRDAARGARVTRWVGVVARSTTATGVSGSAPGVQQARDVGGQQRHAHEEDEAGRAVDDARDGGIGQAGHGHGRHAGAHSATVGQRDAGRGRGGERELTPGTTSTGTPCAAQARGLLAAAAEQERVAALEPDHAAAALGLLDEDPVDLVLRHGVVARGLADVDDLDVGGELVEQAARAEPVGDHDVGLGQSAAGPRTVMRSAAPGPPPTSTTRPRRRVGRAAQVQRGGCRVPASWSRTEATLRAGSARPVRRQPRRRARRAGPGRGMRAARPNSALADAEHAARGGPPAHRASARGRRSRRAPARQRRGRSSCDLAVHQVTSPAATRYGGPRRAPGRPPDHRALRPGERPGRRAATGPPPATSTGTPGELQADKRGHAARARDAARGRRRPRRRGPGRGGSAASTGSLPWGSRQARCAGRRPACTSGRRRSGGLAAAARRCPATSRTRR